MTRNRSEVPWERQVAYHEAGHAVAAFLVHRRVVDVTTVPEEDADGRVRMRNWMDYSPEWEISASTVQRAKRAIFVTVAGPAAHERILRGGRATGCEHDDEDALHLAQRICAADSAALLTWLRARARSYLELNWVAVRAVADALMVERTLSGRRARTIAACASDCGLIDPYGL